MMSIFWLMILLFQASNNCGIEVIEKMIEKNKDLHSLKVDVYIKERIKDKIMEKQNKFIIRQQPFAIYFTDKRMGLDIEGLYCSPWKKALIATKGFPWMKLELDPLDMKMRNETHHTIYEAGFSYFITILDAYKNKFGNSFSSMVSCPGLFQKGNVQYYKIVIDNPDFTYREYIVKKGENLYDIARRYHVNDYMILEKNNLRNYEDIHEGQKILIPSEYAKKMILHVEKNNYIPLYIELYDDKGFYASYFFNNISLNPKLDDTVFDANNPSYHFK